MSGIAGVLHVDRQPVEPGLIEAMTAAMPHRGPDGIAHWRRGPVALGHCMLRTTAESQEEFLPLCNEDASRVLVMDGRVDNWEELRRELLVQGAVLRSRADAELVLRAYERWGEDALAHIDGDFALVIWDALHQKLFCARDRMGNKPFYYHWDGRTLLLASEMPSILRRLPAAPPINPGYLSECLSAYWLSTTETLWQGVLRLEAAHSLTVDASGLRLRRYWSPDPQQRLELPSDAAYAEHHRALLMDLVRRQSRSTQVLACEVSGGLDSSALIAVGERLSQQGQLNAPGIEGYTLAFGGDPGADEMVYSRAVGTHLGRPVHEIEPRAAPLAWYEQAARRYLDFPDFPNGEAMGGPLYEAARQQGARVLLNGIGGDHWLTGSVLGYAEAVAAGRLGELVRMLREDAGTIGRARAAWRLLRYGFAPHLPASARQRLHAWLAPWTRTDEAGDVNCLSDPMRALYAERERAWSRRPLPAIRRVGQRAQMANLTDAYQVLAIEMNERACAHHGLEARQPFWNAHMVSFALAIPERLRLRGTVDKWLHRQAMAGLLPEAVLQRADKAEFSVLFAQTLAQLHPAWTQGRLNDLGDWVQTGAVAGLVPAFQQPDRALWPISAMWTVWTAYGCDLARQEVVRDPWPSPKPG